MSRTENRNTSPKDPPQLHNCPDDIIEGDDHTCECRASPSEPSALVSWYGSGHAVSNTSTLQLTNVSRSLDGQNYTCSQYWGGFSTDQMMTTAFTVNVKYPPPSPPEISGTTSHTEGDSLSLTCTVTGGNPPVSAVTFYCGTHSDGPDTADGETVVSSVSINSVSAGDNGTLCLCFALWDDRPSLYTATSTVTITVVPVTTDSPSTNSPSTNSPSTNSPKDDSSDNSLTVTVGGAVGGVAVVIIVVLAVVIVVLWKRIREPRYAKTTPRGQQDDDHTYTEMDNYEQINPPAPTAAQNERSTVEQHQYENTAGSEDSQQHLPAGNTSTGRQESLSYRHYQNEPETTPTATQNERSTVEQHQYENTAGSEDSQQHLPAGNTSTGRQERSSAGHYEIEPETSEPTTSSQDYENTKNTE
ncbi:uncharacterized protein LOC143291380 [Babylonia areolata]|uniref:uncharacterized protein LOC143291380 n=1 Tax=Babylonia areolata TaxID=304850 RepID=UPI003FD06864